MPRLRPSNDRESPPPAPPSRTGKQRENPGFVYLQKRFYLNRILIPTPTPNPIPKLIDFYFLAFLVLTASWTAFLEGVRARLTPPLVRLDSALRNSSATFISRPPR